MIAVLVFDSASVAVIERMLGEGRLPALASLRGRGARFELDTPARDFAAGAFYSLYSGVELGDHGIFYPFQWSPEEQRARYADAFPAPPAVWEQLAAAGRRTLAIDPYECRPPKRAEGVFVSGWGFHERVVLPRWSRPPAIGGELVRRYGRPPHATEIFGRPSPRALLELRSRLLAAPGRVCELAIDLLGREPFDLVWLTFSASHLAGHQFWDLSQVDESRLGARSRGLLESSLGEIYARVDEAIGHVLRALPDGADVIVASAVGMDVNSSRADLLPGMIEAVLRGPGSAAEPRGGSVWRLRAALPSGLRGAVARALPARAALELTARLELRGLDWSKTPAFAHPADNQGYIRLNVRGRERDGIVEPADADRLAEQIVDGLRSFRDPDGEPAVSSVEPVRELYHGAAADRLPDLIVRWSDRPATGIGAVSSPRFGVVERRGAGSGRSGNHTPGDAWAIVVPGASRLREPGRPPRLVDVAATVAHVVGAPVDGLAGEPLLQPR